MISIDVHSCSGHVRFVAHRQALPISNMRSALVHAECQSPLRPNLNPPPPPVLAPRSAHRPSPPHTAPRRAAQRSTPCCVGASSALDARACYLADWSGSGGTEAHVGLAGHEVRCRHPIVRPVHARCAVRRGGRFGKKRSAGSSRALFHALSRDLSRDPSDAPSRGQSQRRCRLGDVNGA